MALVPQCRVQTIKGKFETLKEPSNDRNKNHSKTSIQGSPEFYRIKSHINTFLKQDKRLDGLNNEYPEDIRTQTSKPRKEPVDDGRVGNAKKNEIENSDPNFPDKQRLVENIVRNIKNYQKTNERKRESNDYPNYLFEKKRPEAHEKDIQQRDLESTSKAKKKESAKAFDSIQHKINGLLSKSDKAEMGSNVPSTDGKNGMSRTMKNRVANYENCILQEPTRPPRKKIPKKKNQAPLPPSMQNASHAEEVSDEEVFSAYYRDPFHADSKRHCSQATRKAPSSCPDGPAPQKPPRTFAHDIYRQTKPFGLERYSPTPNNNCIYTKPSKRVNASELHDLREKSVTFKEPGKSPKPQVAPKPSHLNSKKRFSVIEPMESLPPEFPDKTASVKRNSSFRFSFRKTKQTSPSPTRLSHVSKLRKIAQSWTRLKVSEDQPKHRSRSEEFIYKKTKDPVYDIPCSIRKENPGEELHYMVSPLFPGADEGTQIKPEDHFESSQQSNKKKKNWGGIKNEFRQSCRNVHRKFKAVK